MKCHQVFRHLSTPHQQAGPSLDTPHVQGSLNGLNPCAHQTPLRPASIEVSLILTPQAGKMIWNRQETQMDFSVLGVGGEI